MPKGQYPLSAEIIIYFGQFQLSAKMALFHIDPFGIDRTSFGQALLCSRPSRVAPPILPRYEEALEIFRTGFNNCE